MHRVSVAVLAAAMSVALAGTAGAATVDWRKAPHPAAEATLMDVTAIGGTDAWAVGQLQPPQASGSPVAEHWDGTAWTAVPLPASAGELDGVSAVSSGDVWAVGDTSGQGPIIRHWDGTAWAAVAPAAPPAGQHPGVDRLYDVAAAPTGQVWAVGRYSDRNRPGPVTLIESWDGHAWSRVPSPSPGTLGDSLDAVATRSATDAWAVGWSAGDSGNVALALHWNGKAWTRSPLTLPAGNTELHGVTALAANDVWAVGANEGRPLALHWDGTRWTALARPAITEATLRSVASDGAGGVWAAGDRMTDGGTVARPLFLHWSGGRWTTGTSEEPEGAVYGLARSGASIWAVGTTSPCECFVAPPLVETSP